MAGPEARPGDAGRKAARLWAFAQQSGGLKRSGGKDTRWNGAIGPRPRPHEGRGNHRTPYASARDRTLDGGNVAAFRAWPAGYLAGGRLWRAERFRKDLWPQKIAYTKTVSQDRREMAALSFGGRVVLLARPRRSGGEPIRLDKQTAPPCLRAKIDLPKRV